MGSDTWLADQELNELNLTAEGVLVLGVKRAGEDYIGAPPPDFRLREEDRLIVYGREHRLDELSTRSSGNEAAHSDAMAEHDRDLSEQRERIEEMTAA